MRASIRRWPSLSDRMPGLYLIETGARGERRFHYWRKGSAGACWWQALKAQGAETILESADLVYFSGISLAILTPQERGEFLKTLRGLKRRGSVAFDPNLRLLLWPVAREAQEVFEELVAVSDIVLPSSQDLSDLYGPANTQAHAKRLIALGAREFALTDGEAGCWVYDGMLQHLDQTEHVTAVDTSGAGDAFNGAYLAARLAGDGQKKSAEKGMRLAAQVVTHLGAIMPKPDSPRDTTNV